MAYPVREPERKYTPAPEGLHQAVCVDLVDLGLEQTPWGEIPRVRLVWQLEIMNEETRKRFLVSKKYRPSLHEKATLRKDLECWRGKKFTPDELKGFDLETVLGANAQLQIIHNLSQNGSIYANVQAIVPWNSKSGPKIVAMDYERQKDRAKQHGYDSHDSSDVDDDVVPF
jgi:hypothetical protein